MSKAEDSGGRSGSSLSLIFFIVISPSLTAEVAYRYRSIRPPAFQFLESSVDVCSCLKFLPVMRVGAPLDFPSADRRNECSHLGLSARSQSVPQSGFRLGPPVLEGFEVCRCALFAVLPKDKVFRRHTSNRNHVLQTGFEVLDSAREFHS